MAENNGKVKNYKEFKLENDFTIRQNDEFNVVFDRNRPIKVLKRTSHAYNTILDFKARAKSVDIEKDKIHIEFIIESESKEKFNIDGFCINIGNEYYNFTKKPGDIYQVDIPYDTIQISGNISGIFLFYEDKDGFTFKRKFISMNGPYEKHEDHGLFYSEVKFYENFCIYVYETWAGYLTLSKREINQTDRLKERIKIKLAYLKHEWDVKHERNLPSIILFEKFCGEYEESAKYVYQKLIDDGRNNVYFILDKKSKVYKKIPKKYRSNIINKFSLKHYYEFFNAKVFISTESMNHAIELTTSNDLIRLRQMSDEYYYFFLQHGVMYGYSLKGRNDFTKGHGFRNNSFIVISSEKEGEHFKKDGKFKKNDLIKSGLPKFDYAIKNSDADKILIMPTSRNFEYSKIRDDTENSSYYKFVKNIIESVPKELEEKIIFVPHPLIMEILKDSDLKKYMSDELSYDELLKDTCLLITDYSSISFDAFYRGSNVIFAWMEKEMCLRELGMELKLNDENAFADIAYDYENLSQLILKNYNSPQSEENIRKYEELVEFHDGKNTERLIKFLYDEHILENQTNIYNINDVKIAKIKDYAYTGEEIIIDDLNISYDGKKLIRKLDYTEKYVNNINVGTAKIKIKGKGIYFGEKTIEFKIKNDIGECEIDVDGENISVIKNNEILENEKDYTYKIKDYEGLDIRKVIVKGKGKFQGSTYLLLDTS